MKPRQSRAEFLKRANGRVKKLNARQGIAAMLEFYASQRAENVLVDEDGDMLLFQWGVTPVEPEESYLSITRQFIVTGEDEPYQLSLRFYFSAGVFPADLKSGNRWCRTPQELAEFRRFVEMSPEYRAVELVSPERVELSFAQC